MVHKAHLDGCRLYDARSIDRHGYRADLMGDYAKGNACVALHRDGGAHIAHDVWVRGADKSFLQVLDINNVCAAL